MFRNRPPHHPWVVLITAYITVAVCVGHIYTMGTMFPNIMESFNLNRAQTAVIQSTAYALFGIGGIFYGSFITRMGPQVVCIAGTLLATAGLVISFFATSFVYLTFSLGVLSTIGHAMQSLSCSVVVGQSFKDRQGNIALSILSTAASIGSISYSFVMVYLLDSYGLRGTLLVLAAMAMHGLPLALMWPSQMSNMVAKKTENIKQSEPTHESDKGGKRTDTSQEIQPENGDSSNRSVLSRSETGVIKSTLNTDGTTHELTVINPTLVGEETITSPKANDRTDAKSGVLQSMAFVVRNVNFILLTIGLTIVVPVAFIILIIVVDLTIDKGFTNTDDSTPLAIIHVFSFLGRLAPGFIMLLPKMTALTVPIIASLLGFVSYVMVPFANSLLSMFIAFALSGIAYGMLLTCVTVTVLRLVGKEYMSDAVGIVFTVVGIALTTSGPLTGYIRDQTGSYTPSMFSAAGAMLVGAGIFGVNQYLWVKQHRQPMAQGASIFFITRM